MTTTTWKLIAASVAVVFAAATTWGIAARAEPQAAAQPAVATAIGGATKPPINRECRLAELPIRPSRSTAR